MGTITYQLRPAYAANFTGGTIRVSSNRELDVGATLTSGSGSIVADDTDLDLVAALDGYVPLYRTGSDPGSGSGVVRREGIPTMVVEDPTSAEGHIVRYASGEYRVVPGSVVSGDAAFLVRTPELILVGAITRDANGAATAFGVKWPDGATGAYAATNLSTTFPGAVDAYTVTHVLAGVTKTYTQPAVTRDTTTGAATLVPAITVS